MFSKFVQTNLSVKNGEKKIHIKNPYVLHFIEVPLPIYNAHVVIILQFCQTGALARTFCRQHFVSCFYLFIKEKTLILLYDNLFRTKTKYIGKGIFQ
jgi:hypothetical protein